MYALKDKICLFDLDGTLVDSMPVAVKIVLDFLTEQGISYPDGIVKTLTPLGFKGIAEYYVSHFGVKMPPEEIYACFTKKLSRAYAHEIPLKSDVRETLLALKAQGASLNVLTASPHVFTDVCLQNNGVYALFDNVWSAEDFGMRKSNADLYTKIAARFYAQMKDIVMIDDSLDVIQTAKNAGALTVGIYDGAWEKEWSAMQKTAHFHITEFPQLLTF